MDATHTFLCLRAIVLDMGTRPGTRTTLARNLRLLMDLRGWTQMDVAKRAGVSQKAVSNMLNPATSPRPILDQVEKVAAAFDLNLWHLIMPGLPADLLSSPSISRLVSHYSKASSRGREYIDRVAEHEAGYTNDKNS